MTTEDRQSIISSHENLMMAIQDESRKFQQNYLWLEKAMPEIFFKEVSQEYMMLIAHNLMGFHLQDYFTTIKIHRGAIILCLDSANADLRILENYANYGIKNYRAYVSVSPPPIPGANGNLRIGTIFFTEATQSTEPTLPEEQLEELRVLVKQRNPEVSDNEFERLMGSMNSRFVRALPTDRLCLALDMFFRAKTRDNCQYEVRYNEDWQEKDIASMQIMLAWRNTPKQNFLHRVARTVHRHGLIMSGVNASYVNPSGNHSIVVMALGLHGSDGRAVWDVADIVDFLRELVTIKYFDDFDLVDQALVSTGVLTGNMGNLVRAMVSFIHQGLVHVDSHLYRIEHIEEALCRHPELTSKTCELFGLKLDPDNHNLDKYNALRMELLGLIDRLDTGHEENDLRRKNVLKLAVNFIHYTLKTNFYRRNYTSYAFRIDPKYMDELPFDRKQKFPELPYAIFFIKGMHFFGFHIRFKDLARGGLRTVFPEQLERMVVERNNVFTECYNLAYTQQKKNKDIPEGGSKAVIFLKPFDQLDAETKIFHDELDDARVPEKEIHAKVHQFRKDQKSEYLFHTQRSFIEGLITVINSYPDGRIKAKYMMDYWKRPEYVYLGPDERMSDSMIEWIAEFSKKYEYKPGGAFITSKPGVGINHKEFGVTSSGVNVYMHEVLKHMGIDPKKDKFTIKISGGPDGDVAGNQIKNLHSYYPNTARLVALTDVSGTIYDPEGLDLNIMVDLFKKAKPIKAYPPDQLHEGGFLLDKDAKRDETDLVQHTLCWRKRDGDTIQDWLSGSDMNYMLRHSLHRIPADIFIPAGGRPRTLNASNYQDFLDDRGQPTSRAIVEGANLYLTDKARRKLEELGVLIIKDSSANKGGVICSSYEVMSGLVLSDEEFLENKHTIVEQVLARLRKAALDEAQLMLRTYDTTGMYLTDISDQISDRINHFTYEILDYLDAIDFPEDPSNPIVQSFINYCLPFLRENYGERLIAEIPEHHKKAMVACHIAAQLIYKKGIDWSPSLVETLPLILQDEEIVAAST